MYRYHRTIQSVPSSLPFARCAVRDMVLPQATADVIKTRGITSPVTPLPSNVVVCTSATGGCDVTTSDVTELSANGWLSDKLVGFCVRSVDGATVRSCVILMGTYAFL